MALPPRGVFRENLLQLAGDAVNARRLVTYRTYSSEYLLFPEAIAMSALSSRQCQNDETVTSHLQRSTSDRGVHGGRAPTGAVSRRCAPLARCGCAQIDDDCVPET